MNIPSSIGKTVDDVKRATRLILPGVGAFDYVMKSFNNSGLRDVVEFEVLSEDIPVLGVCAGMQIFASESEEGREKGLGWIPGKINQFDISQIPQKTKVPHMGWNEIVPTDSPLLSNISYGSRFYFVHSYYFEAENESNVIAKTNYGVTFDSAVANGNIYGVQFHPEKSHSNGMKLLKNFAELT